MYVNVKLKWDLPIEWNPTVNDVSCKNYPYIDKHPAYLTSRFVLQFYACAVSNHMFVVVSKDMVRFNKFPFSIDKLYPFI